MSEHHFWLSEARFERLRPRLPSKPRGEPRVDDGRVISGIVHALKTGCRWRDAPPVYGRQETLSNRVVRSARVGVWEDAFRAKTPGCATGGQGERRSAP